MKQIAFILHGKIKRQEKIIAAVKATFGDTVQLIFAVTQHANHAAELAPEMVDTGATHIICLGGDGSLNEVINGIMSAYENGYITKNGKVRVGLLPYGTGNDFARTVGVLNDIVLLKNWIEEDSFRQIDLGWAEFFDAAGKKTNRYFVNITDLGIGGLIAHRLSSSTKFWGPTITYQWSILTALFTYKNRPVKIEADSFNYEGSIMSLIVANGKFFGGGMGIAPDALVDDGLFSVAIIGAITVFEYLKNLGNIKKSRKIAHPEIKYLKASEIAVESSSGPLPVDMDGEFIGYSPMRLRILPEAISFIAPK